MIRHAKVYILLLSLILANFFFIPHSSALTYQQDIPVSFTFNSSVVLTLSSADLNIYNLSPGTSSDSNIIRVTATSNNSTGYVITATVGDNTHSNPSYSNTSLNHISNTGNIFSSIATNADLASLTNDNTWGYAISDNGSTWSNYSGLPLYTAESGKTLKELNTNGTTSFDFKIAAKASSSQLSGEYRNVINFTLTTNAAPAVTTIDDAYAAAGKTKLNGYYKMQDMSSTICSSVDAIDEQAQLIDSRDNKVYYVAKLADGNCWMTQNLDYNIVDGGANLNSANTDVPNNWADGGYLTNTYNTGDNTWYNLTDMPESYDPGDFYWSGTLSDDTASPSGDPHYHIGNYYNWTAAVAMADSTRYVTEGTNVDQSICPANWTLPSGGANTGSGSFRYLINQYGWNYSTYLMEDPYIWESPLYFSLSGSYDFLDDDEGRMQNFGRSGGLWSSTVGGRDYAYDFTFGYDSYVYPYEAAPYREGGESVRCIAK